MSTRPSENPVRLIVVGATGRMGSRVCALAMGDAAFEVVGAVDSAARAGGRAEGAPCAPGGPAVKSVETPGIFEGFSADVVIDFSSDLGARGALAIAQQVGAALLVGTTALSAATAGELRAASEGRAVLVAPNTSLGVAALAALVERAGAVLAGYDCSIVESHHSAKKDAPSGTALRLAEAARRGGAALPESQVVSIRGGDVVGEHTVRFAGPGEYIELTHRATSRDVFARGALRAAAWLRGRGPGWWTMEDVLGLSAR